MPISMTNDMMRAIIMDHYTNPLHKHAPNGDGYTNIHMHSDNCIDDIHVYVKFENDKVVDAFFDGIACTISTASTDIMCELIIGKSKKEALYLADQFMKMMEEEDFDELSLDEAVALANTSKQAARIRCATIGWNGVTTLIKEEDK